MSRKSDKIKLKFDVVIKQALGYVISCIHEYLTHQIRAYNGRAAFMKVQHESLRGGLSSHSETECLYPSWIYGNPPSQPEMLIVYDSKN